jgi:putative PEP-CTERM system TPR-repeat lipoprotein
MACVYINNIVKMVSVTFRLVLLVLVLSSCGGDLTPAEFMDRALESREQGNRAAAIIDLKNVLKVSPKNLEARSLLGVLYLEEGALASAEKELQRSIDYGIAPEMVALPLAKTFLASGKFQETLDFSTNINLPVPAEQAELLALRGHATMVVGELATAESLYQHALSFDRESPEALLGTARVALSRGENESSRAILSSLLASHVDFAQGWQLLGFVEAYDDKLEAAIDAYTKALSDPLTIDVSQQQLALLHIMKGEFPEAAGHISKQRQRSGGKLELDYLEGLLYFNQQQFEQAKDFFDQLLTAMPTHLAGLYYNGVTNAYLGNYESATQQLSAYLARNPANQSAQILLAKVALGLENPEYATQLTLPILEQNPEDITALNLLAGAAFGQGDAQAALNYLQQAAQSKPDSTTAQTRLGMALVRQGLVDEGIKHLEGAYKLDPGDHKIVETLTRSYMSAGQFQQAQDIANAHRDEYPDDPVAHVLVGVVQLGMTNRGEAERAFNKALSLNPASSPAHNALAMMAIQDKRFDLAEQHYRNALKNNASDRQSLLNLLNIKKMEGDTQAQRLLLEQAITGSTGADDLKLRLARLYLDGRESEKALGLLEQVVHSSVPQRIEFLRMRAEAESLLGRNSAARDTLVELSELTPDSANLYLNLSKTYAALGDTAQMHSALKRAQSIDPGYMPVKLARANLAISENDNEQARSLVAELAGELEPEDIRLLNLQARLASLEEDWPQVVVFHQKINNIQPVTRSVLSLSNAHWQMSETEKAEAVLKQWLVDHPADMSVRQVLAQRYIALNQEQDAIKMYQIILAANENDAMSLNNLAALLTESKPLVALSHAQKVYTLMPDDPAVLDTLAGALLASGDNIAAERMIERALEKSAATPSLLYRQVQIIVAQGRKDEARTILSELLESDAVFKQRDEALRLLKTLGGK